MRVLLLRALPLQAWPLRLGRGRELQASLPLLQVWLRASWPSWVLVQLHDKHHAQGHLSCGGVAYRSTIVSTALGIIFPHV